jgi:hypothetical protein
MLLPLEVKRLIKYNSLYLIKNPERDIGSNVRYKLYQRFGPSFRKGGLQNEGKYLVLSHADRTVAWLGILTARKVLPIWEEFGNQNLKECDEHESYNPLEMIMTAEQVLKEEIDEYEARRVRLSNRFYYGIAGLQDVTTEVVYQSIQTAYFALGVTIHGWDSTNRPYWGDIPKLMYDFAKTAVRAYAGKDENPPGLWSEVGYYHKDPPANYKSLEIDLDKKIEFWKWWLTEAIPQAWELAQQSISQ